MKAYLPVIFALLTALSWGLYGPALATARASLQSPFKPYVMIGIAYLVWAIGGGAGLMSWKGDSFSFTGSGSLWGFNAGTLGAIGALMLTMAMFSGGTAMPHIIMPIVFGGAVTVNAIVAIMQTRGVSHGSGVWLGIAVILVGVIVTAYNTPHVAPAKKPPTPVASK